MPAPEPPPAPPSTEALSLRRYEIRIELIKWVVGSVALTLITTIGNWTFQYHAFMTEKEKTQRELKIKERDMQLQYLEKITTSAIDQDITTRIRLAHYISSTIDDDEYQHLARRWLAFYDQLKSACQEMKMAQQAQQGGIKSGLDLEPDCSIGGTRAIGTARDLPLSAITPGPGGLLGELVAIAETNGQYEYSNRGTPDSGSTSRPLSAMSIDGIFAAQALPADDPHHIFAVGKYGLIPITLRDAVSKLNIARTSMFDASLQERIFRDYMIAIKRPAVKSFITGVAGGSLRAAQQALALEFATLARPDTGHSAYGGGRDYLTSDTTARVLTVEQARYAQMVGNGMSPEEAWEALSPGIGARAAASSGAPKDAAASTATP